MSADKAVISTMQGYIIVTFLGDVWCLYTSLNFIIKVIPNYVINVMTYVILSLRNTLGFEPPAICLFHCSWTFKADAQLIWRWSTGPRSFLILRILNE